MADPERLAFALNLLVDAAHQSRSLRGCDNGHLVVAERNHFQPEKFSYDLKTVTCRRVDNCDG